MNEFINKHLTLLQDNFKRDVLDHVGNEPYMKDEAFKKTMFLSFADDEEKFNADAYAKLSSDVSNIIDKSAQNLMEQNLQEPQTYIPPRGDVPQVREMIPSTISKPDLGYRAGPAPKYIGPKTPWAFAGVEHGTAETLRAAEEAFLKDPRKGLSRENWHFDRNMNNHIPATRQVAIDAGWTERSASQNIYHKWLGKDDLNKKYTSPSGHFEAVIDGMGNIVRNPESVGTLNYYSPDDEKNHSKFDVTPYFKYGNTRNDSTSELGRVWQSADYLASKRDEIYQKLKQDLNSGYTVVEKHFIDWHNSF